MTPTFKEGDMWSAYGDGALFCVTTNSTLNRAGELVMGRGIALELKRRHPDFPKAAGDLITRLGVRGKTYHLLRMEPLALFQVKHKYDADADLDLIQGSVHALSTYLRGSPGRRAHLNFPGIGAGHLPRAHVLPLLDALPETCTVWEKPAPAALTPFGVNQPHTGQPFVLL